jgi:hypothetical protein
MEEGGIIVEILGFENINGNFYVNLKTLNTEFKISFSDFSKSMRKKWKKLL